MQDRSMALLLFKFNSDHLRFRKGSCLHILWIAALTIQQKHLKTDEQSAPRNVLQLDRSGSSKFLTQYSWSLTNYWRSLFPLRGDYLDQIRWIFGKLPNGRGGSFPIRKIMLRFFGKGKALRAPISRTKAQHFFPKIGWGRCTPKNVAAKSAT